MAYRMRRRGFGDMNSDLALIRCGQQPPAVTYSTVAGLPVPDLASVQAFQAWTSCMNAQGIPFTSTPPPATPVSYPTINPGTLSFINNRTGTGGNFQVGDTWTVMIRGASPNQPVWVAGLQNGNSLGMTPMGSTDSAGNFSKSGVMTPDTVGLWVEVWQVGPPDNPTGGLPKFTFAVTQGGGGAPPPLTCTLPQVLSADGKSCITPAAGGGGSGPLTCTLPLVLSADGTSCVTPAAGGSSSSSSSAGFDISKVPWWGWLAAAGVAVVALGGKH